MALSKEVYDDWCSAVDDFVMEDGKDMSHHLAHLKQGVDQLKHENAALLRLLVKSEKEARRRKMKWAAWKA